MGQAFYYCWKHFLKTHIGQSVTAPEFWGFHKNQSLTRGQIRQERRGGNQSCF